MTLVRWIDLGCPIDLDFDPKQPEAAGFGWMLDDQRPTLALAVPRAGKNPPLERILVGAYDLGGIVPETFRVVANFAVNGVTAGENLASRFRPLTQGVWELRLDKPMTVTDGKLIVSIRDHQGNEARIERSISADDRLPR